jgi:hypothetical protein
MSVVRTSGTLYEASEAGCAMSERVNKAPSKKQGATPFARFQNLIRGLVAVPKKEVEIEEARWRANRPLKKKNAG